MRLPVSHPCCEAISNGNSGSSCLAKIFYTSHAVAGIKLASFSRLSQLPPNACPPECISTVEMSPCSSSYFHSHSSTGHRLTFLLVINGKSRVSCFTSSKSACQEEFWLISSYHTHFTFYPSAVWGIVLGQRSFRCMGITDSKRKGSHERFQVI